MPAIERMMGVKLIWRASKSLTYVTLKKANRQISEYTKTTIERLPLEVTMLIREKYISEKITAIALICLKTFSCSLKRLNFQPFVKTF